MSMQFKTQVQRLDLAEIVGFLQPDGGKKAKHYIRGQAVCAEQRQKVKIIKCERKG